MISVAKGSQNLCAMFLATPNFRCGFRETHNVSSEDKPTRLGRVDSKRLVEQPEGGFVSALSSRSHFGYLEVSPQVVLWSDSLVSRHGSHLAMGVGSVRSEIFVGGVGVGLPVLI